MRAFWTVFGVAAHGLFAVTVLRLFPFLQGEGRCTGVLTARAGTGLSWYALDALLAAQFAVLHSYFLLPGTRRRWERVVPGPQYGCFFCVVTCLSLLLTIECWQPSPGALWRLDGAAGWAVRTAFLLTWPALLYSLSLTGLGYQTGWTPWWAWLRGRRPPPRRFPARGAYRVLRHPIYLSFLGLIWLTPAMTLDRALLTAAWTTYIFVGSHLKDRRLVHYLGEEYRAYQARVPGYPFLPFGPLGKVPLPPEAPPREIRRAA